MSSHEEEKGDFDEHDDGSCVNSVEKKRKRNDESRRIMTKKKRCFVPNAKQKDFTINASGTVVLINFAFLVAKNCNLQADSSKVRMNHVDNGSGYLHGEGCSATSAKNGTCARTSEVQIRDQTKEAIASEWKSKENGSIPCPLADMGGCGKGTLNLRCIISANWISQLLVKAQEIATRYKLKEMHNAASRETSDENYVFCPAAGDAQSADLRHFQLSLAKGEPVVLMNLLDNALRLC
ncbi:hypothetical protein BC332_06551 [Capsicum chinense]|nr:hypothetical protein BC332_06551 [Capsicum chinense]